MRSTCVNNVVLACVAGVAIAATGCGPVRSSVPTYSEASFEQERAPVLNGRILWVKNWTDVWRMNANGNKKTRLFHVGFAWEAEWSPDGSKIAYAEHADGEIYTVNFDGTEPTRVTDTPLTNEDMPSWSPSGRKLTFISDQTGYNQIFTMDADGTDRVQLTRTFTHNSAPQWSPDGTRIAYDCLDQTDVCVVNVDGTGRRRVGTGAGRLTESGLPQWSPDSTRLVFADKTARLVVVTPDGSDRRRITSERTFAFAPDWSPDGQKIVFTCRFGYGTSTVNDEICSINTDGTGLKRMTFTPEHDDMRPSWKAQTFPYHLGIEITPGVAGNVISVSNPGSVAVGIHGAADVPARSIRTDASLCFGRGREGSLRSCGPTRFRYYDVNGDGLEDLEASFKVSETRFEVGDGRGCVFGRVTEPSRFMGCAPVTIKP